MLMKKQREEEVVHCCVSVGDKQCGLCVSYDIDVNYIHDCFKGGCMYKGCWQAADHVIMSALTYYVNRLFIALVIIQVTANRLLIARVIDKVTTNLFHQL